MKGSFAKFGTCVMFTLTVAVLSVLRAAAAPPPPLPPPPAAGMLPIVGTALGDLQCAPVGTQSRQCLGVPFAAPPTGKLRWRPPALPEAWAGVRDATAAKPACLQANDKPVPGRNEEDCLYLNIYAPRSPPPLQSGPSGLYPVVVWIHGGGYQTGAPPNGTALVEQSGGSIIFIGINYRMGWAGFLGAEQLRALDTTDGSTGNAGIQDQRAALEWVQTHIASFGGDPKRVTIDGCSAGAGSVAVHVTSPKAWTSFSQAAAQSGMLAAWNSLPLDDATTFYQLFAAAAGCTDNATAVACLEPKGSAELAAAAAKAWTTRVAQADYAGNNNYAPVLDGVEVVDTPINLLRKGEYDKLHFNVAHGVVCTNVVMCSTNVLFARRCHCCCVCG